MISTNPVRQFISENLSEPCRPDTGDDSNPVGGGSRSAVIPPPHVQSWIDFLTAIEVRGPIPIKFSVLRDRYGVWILRSEMQVPGRDAPTSCASCARPHSDRPVIIQNVLPGPNDPTPRERVIRQRVLGHYQHEALESLLIAGQRLFDPHAARWYSNLVANWRFNS